MARSPGRGRTRARSACQPPAPVTWTSTSARISPRTRAIDWDPAAASDPPVTGYLVSVTGRKALEITDTSVVVSDLQPETLYQFTVQSVSGGGLSDPVNVWARTGSKPDPGPAPKPQPFTPPDPTPDPDPTVKQQTAPGSWPKKLVARSGKALPIEKKSGFVTNAGQTATLVVSGTSKTVKKVTISLNKRTRTFVMTPILERGKKSGTVTLAVTAPSATANGLTYQPLLSVQQFTVCR